MSQLNVLKLSTRAAKKLESLLLPFMGEYEIPKMSEVIDIKVDALTQKTFDDLLGFDESEETHNVQTFKAAETALIKLLNSVDKSLNFDEAFTPNSIKRSEDVKQPEPSKLNFDEVAKGHTADFLEHTRKGDVDVVEISQKAFDKLVELIKVKEKDMQNSDALSGLDKAANNLLGLTKQRKLAFDILTGNVNKDVDKSPVKISQYERKIISELVDDEIKDTVMRVVTVLDSAGLLKEPKQKVEEKVEDVPVFSVEFEIKLDQ